MKIKNILIAIFISVIFGSWMYSKQIAELSFVKNILTKNTVSPEKKADEMSPEIQAIYDAVDAEIANIPDDADIQDDNGNKISKSDLRKQMVAERIKSQGTGENTPKPTDMSVDQKIQQIYAEADSTVARIPEDAEIRGDDGKVTTKEALRKKIIADRLTQEGIDPNGEAVAKFKQQSAQNKPRKVALETKLSMGQPYTKKITLPAKIGSKGYLSIHSRINNSTVKKILVKNGQKVKKGQLLVELSSDFIPEQYTNHKEKYEITLSKFNADKKLFEKKLIAKYTFMQSQNAMTAAKVQMLATKKTYDHHFIRAPFSGVVDMIYVNSFEQINANTKLLDLNDRKSYTVTASLPVHTLKNIKIGTKFISKDALGREIVGVISGISSNANASTSTYASEGTITSKGPFNIGESLYIQILTQTVIAHEIPLSQVSLDEEGKMAIKVVENGTVVLKNISIVDENLKIAKVTGLGQTVILFTSGAGFAEVGEPYPNNKNDVVVKQ